jgi:hypothetical protein
MPEQPPTPGPLTSSQRSRICFARNDPARFEDASRLDDAGLILLVERLRGRLDDILHLLDEIAPPAD